MTKNPPRVLAGVGVAATALLAAGASGTRPDPPDLLTASNVKARAVLQRAVESHGGEAALRGIRTIRFEDEGRSFMLHQGPLPGRPLTARAVGARVELDFERGRGCHAPHPFTHTDTQRLAEMTYVYHPRTIVRDGQLIALDHWSRTRAAPRPGGLEELRTQQRALPTRWLVEALDAAHTLRFLGEEQRSSRASQLVALGAADARSVALRFDGGTGLLESVEALSVHPVDGDTRTSTVFSDYRRVGGLMMPHRRVVRTERDVLLDVRLKRLAVDEPLDESCLEVPEGFALRTAAERPAAGALPLADGVFLLQGLAGQYNGLAILFDAFAMLIEAPENSPSAGAARQALAMLRQVGGSRPLRYLAFSHAHLDHAGGIRDYVAEGVTIVATRASRDWIEEAARSSFTILPDRLARAPRAPSVEVFEGRRHVIEDGRMRVEIHLLPWDHAREEAFFYVPSAKLVFEGDLFASGEGDAPMAQGSALQLDARIRELGLDVERIAGVHAKPRPYADLKAAIERRRRRLELEPSSE